MVQNNKFRQFSIILISPPNYRSFNIYLTKFSLFSLFRSTPKLPPHAPPLLRPCLPMERGAGVLLPVTNWLTWLPQYTPLDRGPSTGVDVKYDSWRKVREWERFLLVLRERISWWSVIRSHRSVFRTRFPREIFVNLIREESVRAKS